ncbi:MAG: PAS domain-containing protein [Myxococcales bacterium]|nr:PAS domain-containing protein [Myxococcales bacterium]
MNQASAMERFAQAGTWDWDVANNRLHWSPELSRIYGIGRGEAPSDYEAFLARVHPDDRELTRTTVERALLDRRDIEYQHRILREDGEVRVLRSYVHVDCNADSDVVRLSGACQDVTENVELTERVKRLQALASAGTIAAGLAHDLNNVVGALTLLCSALTPEGGEDNARLVEDIKQTAMRTSLFTSRIHQLARTSVGMNPRVDVRKELERITGVLQDVFADRLAVSLQVRDPLAHVRVDALDLERVIWNLALNARDAQPNGGVIEIVAERVTVVGHGPSGEYVRITVRDEGAGMDEHTAARLFEPFFTTKGASGTGLGLAVVHDIVDDAGGFVTVDSRRGVGTRLRVHLPAK